MFSSLLRWLDGDDDAAAEPTTDGSGDAESPPPPPVSRVDLLNEHIAGIQVAAAENRVIDACELMAEFYKLLDAEAAKVRAGEPDAVSIPAWNEMAAHTNTLLLNKIITGIRHCGDTGTAAKLWAGCLLLRNYGDVEVECRQRALNLLADVMEESIARMNTIRGLLQVSTTSALASYRDAPSWLYMADGSFHPYFLHHSDAVRRFFQRVGGVSAAPLGQAPSTVGAPEAVDPTKAFSRSSSGEGEKQQPHIESLTKIFSETSVVLVEMVGLAFAHSQEPSVVVHGACGPKALHIISAYRDDNMLDVTRRLAQAMLDHSYVYDTSLLGSGTADGRAAFAIGHDILGDLLEVRPDTRKSKAITSKWVPFEIPIDLGLGVVDECADEVSFLCQVIERYLRFVTTGMHVGTMDQPSRLDDPLSAVLHDFHGEYVILERAYVVTSARHSVFSAAAWYPCSVHENAAILTYGWCDNIFFLLSKAIARSMATYTDIAAAATINYVSSCIEDIVLQAAKECVDRCRGLSKSGNPATGFKPREDSVDEVEAALVAKFSNAMGDPGRRTAEEEHAHGATAASTQHDDPVALNTVVTAVTFANDLLNRALSEATVAFPGFALGQAKSHLQLTVPFQELRGVIGKLDTVAGEAAAGFISHHFQTTFEALAVSLGRCTYQLSNADFDRLHTSDAVLQCLRNGLLHSPKGLPWVMDRVLQPFASEQLMTTLATQLATQLERSWFNTTVNEIGALLMQHQLLGIQDILSPFSAITLRPIFRKAQQITEVLAVESVSELAALVFPVPALSRMEVERLVSHHTSLSRRPLDGVQWEKLVQS